MRFSDECAAKCRGVLVLAHYYPPDNVSGAARPYRFVRYLPQFGYNCQVIAASRAGGAALPETIRVPGPAISKSEFLAGRLAEGIERWLLPYNECLPWLPHAIAEGARLIETEGPKILLSTSPPMSGHLAALFLKKRFDLPWVADFRDPLFGNPFRRRKGARLYDAALERFIFSNADLLIANTDAVAAMWRARYPKASHKIEVIWNGYDPAQTPPIQETPKVSGPKVLAHIGNLYEQRDPGLLLRSMERLVRRERLQPTSLRLEFIGPINGCFDAFPDIVSALEKAGCLRYNDCRVPREEANRYMFAADALFLIDANADNAGLQVPAKVFDYILAGRPILALTPSGSPTTRILNRSGIAYACIHPEMSESTIDDVFMSFLLNPFTRYEPSEWFLKHCSAVPQAQYLAGLLDGLEFRHSTL